MIEGGVYPHARFMPSVDAITVREIFQEYADFVWRTLRYLGVRESDLPDLCQEVFVVVHRRLPDFEGRSTIRTWLYGICIRVARSHQRRAHVRREVAVDETPERTTDAPQAGDLARRQARETLQRALAELDEDKRTVFVLYEIEELTLREIAEIVGCPLQTAYSRLNAARRLVHQAVHRTLGEKP